MKFACSRSFDTSKKFWVHWILVLLGTTCSSFCIHLKILLHGSHTMTLIDHLFQSQIEKRTSIHIYRNIYMKEHIKPYWSIVIVKVEDTYCSSQWSSMAFNFSRTQKISNWHQFINFKFSVKEKQTMILRDLRHISYSSQYNYFQATHLAGFWTPWASSCQSEDAALARLGPERLTLDKNCFELCVRNIWEHNFLKNSHGFCKIL